MASWSAAVAYTEAPPIEERRSLPRARRRRDPLRSGVVWIVVAAAVLAGLVALNVAVLQLNVRLDQLSLAMASIVCALPFVLPLVYFMMKRLSR